MSDGDFRWLSELNPQQREAVTAGEGPVLVIAGAGTGKTRTLAYRVAWLLGRGVPAESILLLTFTRRAAQEMLQRAAGVVRRTQPDLADQARRVWGGTFHATANRLLRIYGQAVGLPANFSILDATDAEGLMNIVRHEQGLASRDKRFPRKATCLAIYSRCVNSGEDLEAVLEHHFPWCAEYVDELRALFRAYVNAKQARRSLDYDDLLLYWYHLLDTPPGAKAAARFRYVLVDEYQDTNRLQGDILHRMFGYCRNIMVVGDDAQSIYSFRAAEVENILRFPERFEGARLITLEQNYRSVGSILDVSNAVIGEARRQYRKRLWSRRRGEQRPELVFCRDEDDEARLVIERVLGHYEEGIPLRRQAVLFRAAHNSDRLEVELTRRNIPYVKYGGLRFLEAAHVKDVLAFVRILENVQDQIAWFRVLEMHAGVGPRTAGAVFAHVVREGGDPRAVGTFAAPPAAREGLRALADLFDDLCAAGPGVNCGALLDRIYEYYMPLMEEMYENPEPRRRDLEQLRQVAAGYRSRAEFLADLVLEPPNSTADFAGPPRKDEDWLVLSTIHSAKGCEWDAVYVIHATDGVIPSDMGTGTEKEIEEERRLFYVALTRARDWLYVFAPMRYAARTSATVYPWAPALLTRFISPAVRREFVVSGPAGSEEEDLPVIDVNDDRSITRRIRAMWD